MKASVLLCEGWTKTYDEWISGYWKCAWIRVRWLMGNRNESKGAEGEWRRVQIHTEQTESWGRWAGPISGCTCDVQQMSGARTVL